MERTINWEEVKVKQGKGLGVYEVYYGGYLAGEVRATSRFGYKYWKITHNKKTYTTRKEAVADLIIKTDQEIKESEEARDLELYCGHFEEF